MSVNRNVTVPLGSSTTVTQACRRSNKNGRDCGAPMGDAIALDTRPSSDQTAWKTFPSEHLQQRRSLGDALRGLPGVVARLTSESGRSQRIALFKLGLALRAI